MQIRLFPGQVVVREDHAAQYKGAIVIPDTVMANERARKWHRGKVIAKGPPATWHGHAVPHGFDVGDEVLFHFAHHEKSRTRPWPHDGLDAVWLTQAEIDAVVEP